MAKGKGWHGQSRRHSLASKGVKTVCSKPATMFKAPLSSKSTKLPIQLGITVPSTDYDKKISNEAFQKRIKETAKNFSSKFGGDTAIKGKGDYTSEGRLIREDVVVIESSMTKKDYQKNKPKIEQFIKDKKKEWNQESIGYSFEDDFYIYPKF